MACQTENRNMHVRDDASPRPGGPPAGRRGPRAGHLATLALSLAACRTTLAPADVAPTHTDPSDERQVSGARALETLRTWLDAPRSLGDPRRVASIAALAQALARSGADRVEQVPHVADGPGDTGSYALVELVAHFRERAPRRFVLATHFDTRPWADEEPDPARHATPVPGANDGTSGLAVVLELVGPLLARLPEDVGLSVILFDGEELGRPGVGGYCMGSRHLAERIAAGHHPTLATAEFGIVLDMVGDADLRLRPEPNSVAFHPRLVDHLWGTARALGVDAFDPEVRGVGIVDDHKFLSQAGIPSVLVIDRDYAAWHRVDDTLDRVAADSLGAVGTVVLEAVVRWYER